MWPWTLVFCTQKYQRLNVYGASKSSRVQNSVSLGSIVFDRVSDWKCASIRKSRLMLLAISDSVSSCFRAWIFILFAWAWKHHSYANIHCKSIETYQICQAVVWQAWSNFDNFGKYQQHIFDDDVPSDPTYCQTGRILCVNLNYKQYFFSFNLPLFEICAKYKISACLPTLLAPGLLTDAFATLLESSSSKICRE